MKCTLAALAVAFTIGFASPSFADDKERPYPGIHFDNLLKCAHEAPDDHVLEPKPTSKAEAEHIERSQAEAEANAKAEAQREAELEAEVEDALAKEKRVCLKP